MHHYLHLALMGMREHAFTYHTPSSEAYNNSMMTDIVTKIQEMVGIHVQRVPPRHKRHKIIRAGSVRLSA